MGPVLLDLQLCQLRAAMDAVRIEDGRQVMLKMVLPEEGHHELLITQLFSSPGIKGDPKNHCVPLLDLVDLSQTGPDGKKLMVIPFLRPFKNPRFQTYGEFVAFFTQISEVGPKTPSNSIGRSFLTNSGPSGPQIYAPEKSCTQVYTRCNTFTERSNMLRVVSGIVL